MKLPSVVISLNGAQLFKTTTPENLVDPKLAQGEHRDSGLACHLRCVFRTTKSNELGFEDDVFGMKSRRRRLMLPGMLRSHSGYSI